QPALSWAGLLWAGTVRPSQDLLRTSARDHAGSGEPDGRRGGLGPAPGHVASTTPATSGDFLRQTGSQRLAGDPGLPQATRPRAARRFPYHQGAHLSTVGRGTDHGRAVA